MYPFRPAEVGTVHVICNLYYHSYKYISDQTGKIKSPIKTNFIDSNYYIENVGDNYLNVFFPKY